MCQLNSSVTIISVIICVERGGERDRESVKERESQSDLQ